MRRKEEVTRKLIFLSLLYVVMGSAALICLINWLDYTR